MKVGVTEICMFTVDGIICSFLLSLIILFIAKIKTDLNSAFYHCLLAVLVSDFLFSAVHMTLFMKFPRYGLFTDFYKANQWTGSVAYAGTSLFTITQYLGQTLISFNRFTALWMPFYHKRIWKSKWYVPVVTLVPIIYISYRFTAPGVMNFKEDGNVEIGYADKKYEQQVLQILSYMYGSNMAISAILNLLSVIKYFKIRKSTAMVPNDTSVQLLIYSLILLCIQIVRFSYTYVRFLFVNNYVALSIIETALQYIVEIHAVIAFVAIMLLSSVTRKSYFKFYFSWCRGVFSCCFGKGYLFEPTTSVRIGPAA